MTDIDVQLTRGDRTWRQALRSEARRIGICGPSGAGKSTLLRIVAGLEPTARGRVVVRGRTLLDGARAVPPWERRVGWVPQDSLLFPHVDVLANLRWAGASADAALQVAEALEIDPLVDRMPRHLSGGERQRVALGRALLAPADILLLDEPFTALDPALRRRVIGVLDAHLASTGASLLLVSHGEDGLDLVEEYWVVGAGGALERAGGHRR